MPSLYNNIKNQRIFLGMSQEDLAKKTGYTNRSSIAKIEKGLVDIPQTKIGLFAKALGVSEAWLLGYDVQIDSSLSPDEAWDKETEAFQDEFNIHQEKKEAFQKQLKILGWTCSEITNDLQPDDNDFQIYYEIKSAKSTFKISLKEYEEFLDDIEAFYKKKLQKLFMQSASSLFDEPEHLLVNAAHERTDIEVTDEMRKHDDAIMDDENF